ncbi:hypothetical protein V8E54_006471 [Elaphomyces granulatus]
MAPPSSSTRSRKKISAPIQTLLLKEEPRSLGRYQNAVQARSVYHIWTTLFAIFPGLHGVISADTVNETKNVITLLEVLNMQFGKLNFALEPTDQENTYEVILYKVFPGVYKTHLHGVRQVTFEAHNHCDLPSRILLETHAALARIFNASGKGEQIDKVLRDCDEIRCLASDGSTDIETLLPILLCRMDHFVPVAERFIAGVFGREFFDGSSDLEDVVEQVTATAPIALSSSPGFDASYKVDALVERMHATCANIAMLRLPEVG